MTMAKQYLGDGVYVIFDGYALVLTTEDGLRVTNRIVLEPELYEALHGYVQAVKYRAAEAMQGTASKEGR